MKYVCYLNVPFILYRNLNDHQKYFVRMMNHESWENILNVSNFLFYAIKPRPSKMNMAALP